MRLPQELQSAIEEKAAAIKHSGLLNDAKTLSERYREGSAKGKSLLSLESEAIAYAASRMPATFCAVQTALQYALELTDLTPKSLLDVGAGTGSASWAVDSLLDLSDILCLEREKAMSELGQNLMQNSESLKSAKWQSCDLSTQEILESKDLIIVSYVLNELDDITREKALEKLKNATNMMLLIIEPGTTVAYKKLMQSRDFLLQKGMHLLAPCPRAKPCPLPNGDWCHFSCRVERTRLHKSLKDGTLGYEDEKFSYLAFTKNPCNAAESRVLRHPLTEKSKITLNLCTKEGLQKSILTKKDGENYKKAKKSKWGDRFY